MGAHDLKRQPLFKPYTFDIFLNPETERYYFEVFNVARKRILKKGKFVLLTEAEHAAQQEITYLLGK